MGSSRRKLAGVVAKARSEGLSKDEQLPASCRRGRHGLDCGQAAGDLSPGSQGQRPAQVEFSKECSPRIGKALGKIDCGSSIASR